MFLVETDVKQADDLLTLQQDITWNIHFYSFQQASGTSIGCSCQNTWESTGHYWPAGKTDSEIKLLINLNLIQENSKM